MSLAESLNICITGPTRSGKETLIKSINLSQNENILPDFLSSYHSTKIFLKKIIGYKYTNNIDILLYVVDATNLNIELCIQELKNHIQNIKNSKRILVILNKLDDIDHTYILDYEQYDNDIKLSVEELVTKLDKLNINYHTLSAKKIYESRYFSHGNDKNYSSNTVPYIKRRKLDPNKEKYLLNEYDSDMQKFGYRNFVNNLNESVLIYDLTRMESLDRSLDNFQYETNHLNNLLDNLKKQNQINQNILNDITKYFKSVYIPKYLQNFQVDLGELLDQVDQVNVNLINQMEKLLLTIIDSPYGKILSNIHQLKLKKQMKELKNKLILHIP